jgi:hypothetical protein
MRSFAAASLRRLVAACALAYGLAAVPACTSEPAAEKDADVDEDEGDEDEGAARARAERPAIVATPKADAAKLTGGDGDEAAAAAQRKMIYASLLDLEVHDVLKLAQRLEAMAREMRGYLSESSVTGSPENGRVGSFKLRVPLARHDATLARLGKLGRVTRLEKSAKDVTAQWIDVDARLRNKTLQEERLRDLLRRAPRFADVLKAEQELTRVRAEIETLTTQMTTLRNQVTLATIEIAAREDRIAFGAVLERAFAGATAEAFKLGVRSAHALLLVLAVVLPWAALALAGAYVLRLRKRRAPGKVARPAAPLRAVATRAAAGSAPGGAAAVGAAAEERFAA